MKLFWQAPGQWVPKRISIDGSVTPGYFYLLAVDQAPQLARIPVELIETGSQIEDCLLVFMRFQKIKSYEFNQAQHGSDGASKPVRYRESQVIQGFLIIFILRGVQHTVTRKRFF
jgi:hypothetical protein